MTAQVVSKAQHHAARAGMPIAPKRRREKSLNPAPTPRYRQPKSCTRTPAWRPRATAASPAPRPARRAAMQAPAQPTRRVASTRNVIAWRRIGFVVGAIAIIAAFTLWAMAVIAAGSDIAVGGQVTVAHGQTLWSIASEHAAPGVDVREVIAQIITLNDLSSSGVHVGQQLLLPAH